MTYIRRIQEKVIKESLFQGKAVIILGARQTGKTTLLEKLVESAEDVLWLIADDPDVQMLLENATSSRLKSILAGKKILVIDEAQRILNIGIKLKLITDQVKSVQLIVTGSSSLELANKVNEPLTGRKWEMQLYPLSFEEMCNHHGFLEEKRLLPHRMVTGYYPEVVTNPGNEKKVLREITSSYLYKDLLVYQGINKPEKLIKLLQALAYQLGQEVSYNELSQLLEMDKGTVEKYINLLEKTFVIFKLGALNRNLRKELKQGRKIYFYDNGVRNSLIANFTPLESRQDIGALWENFLLSERMKHLHYHGIWANSYFWRTQDQQEIDYVEERDGKFYAYEFKWNSKLKFRFSKTFLNAYPENVTQLINKENFEAFVMC